MDNKSESDRNSEEFAKSLHDKALELTLKVDFFLISLGFAIAGLSIQTFKSDINPYLRLIELLGVFLLIAASFFGILELITMVKMWHSAASLHVKDNDNLKTKYFSEINILLPRLEHWRIIRYILIIIGFLFVAFARIENYVCNIIYDLNI